MKAKYFINGKEVSAEHVAKVFWGALTDEEVRTIVEEKCTDISIKHSYTFSRVFAAYLVQSDIGIFGRYTGSIRIDKDTLGFDYTVEYIKKDE